MCAIFPAKIFGDCQIELIMRISLNFRALNFRIDLVKVQVIFK